MLLSDALRLAITMLEREPTEPHRWALAFPSVSRRRVEVFKLLEQCVDACERGERAPRTSETLREMTMVEDVATVGRVQRALRDIGDASLARLQTAWEGCGFAGRFEGPGPWKASVPNGNEALVLHVSRRASSTHHQGQEDDECDLSLSRNLLSPASESAGGKALD